MNQQKFSGFWFATHAPIPQRITCKNGSERESEKGRILCGFLKDEKLGLGGGQPLRLEQQVVHIAVAAATT